MNLPMNYEERTRIVDKVCGMNGQSQLFEFSEILDWKNKNMLEEGDLFIIEKDGDYWFSIVYLNKKWFAITGDPKLVEISEEELSQYKFFNKNAVGDNPYQEFLKREGQEKFNSLSYEEKCYVYSDQYFTRHVNDILDGLKNTLSDVVDIFLKDEKEKVN